MLKTVMTGEGKTPMVKARVFIPGQYFQKFHKAGCLEIVGMGYGKIVSQQEFRDCVASGAVRPEVVTDLEFKIV